MSVLGKGVAVLAAALVLMLAAYGGASLVLDLREPSPALAASNQMMGMMGMGSSSASSQTTPNEEMVELCTRHMQEMQPVMERMMDDMMRDMMR